MLELLAKAWEARMGGDHKDFLAKMRLLALEMCKRVGPRGEFEQDDAVAVLADDFQQFAHGPKRTAAARDFPLEGQTGSGVIVGSGSSLEFWHPTFGEALAAHALADDPSQASDLLFEIKRFYDDQRWREVILLLAGELKSKGNAGVNKLLQNMLRQGERPGIGLKDRARCVGIVGAGVEGPQCLAVLYD